MKILLLLCLFLLVIKETQSDHGSDDYFSEAFDAQKNCQYKKLMKKLKKEKKCAEVTRGCFFLFRFQLRSPFLGTDAIQWEECKKIISNKIIKKCALTHVLKVRLFIESKI